MSGRTLESFRVREASNHRKIHCQYKSTLSAIAILGCPKSRIWLHRSTVLLLLGLTYNLFDSQLSSRSNMKHQTAISGSTLPRAATIFPLALQHQQLAALRPTAPSEAAPVQYREPTAAEVGACCRSCLCRSDSGFCA